MFASGEICHVLLHGMKANLINISFIYGFIYLGKSLRCKRWHSIVSQGEVRMHIRLAKELDVRLLASRHGLPMETSQHCRDLQAIKQE
jgi:hypothetical protein